MRMDLGLTQTIKQIQTLSPQMYMSMEILCLNSLDLEERIETELENNVALEVTEGRTEAADAEAARVEAAEDPLSSDATFDRKVEQWDQLAREEYDGGPRSRGSYDGDRDEKLEALNNTEGRPQSLAEHLKEQLQMLTDEDLAEAGVAPGEGPAVRELCEEIFFNLDERGYLMYPLEEIYESLRRDFPNTRQRERLPPDGSGADGRGDDEATVQDDGAAVQDDGAAVQDDGAVRDGRGAAAGAQDDVERSLATADTSLPALSDDAVSPLAGPPFVIHEETVEAAVDARSRQLASIVTMDLLRKSLEVVYRLDPPGLGGTDLKDCLLLQLRRDGQAYPIETKIIENHLDDLANNRLPKIAKALSISVEDVKSAAETIASLNPLPGKLYGGESPHYIKPDVVVEEVDGAFDVQVTSDYLPRLRVSDYYLDLYKRSRKDPELKKFIKKKLESAEWLLAAIRQRQSTLERIAREIVDIQGAFFAHGVSHLKPLKMVDVAERVGVHVSTVSRAISGKYVQSPQGLHELKSFFTGGAQKSDGTVEARGSVIQRIKELVEEEDKQNPLSDIDIVHCLEETGIKISRRTVTKYREAEGIPSSRQRRAY